MRSGGSACGAGAIDFEEFPGTHVVEVAVDGNGFGHESVIANACHIVEHSSLLVFDGEPLDVLASARTGPFADIAEATGSEFGGLQAGIQKTAHDVVSEEFHSAIGVMEDEEFAGAK